MNLNHDVGSSPKEQKYLNGSIDDFTDCIDFTKQYQKSCGLGDENPDGVIDVNISISENKDTCNGDNNENSKQRENINVESCDEKSCSKVSEEKDALLVNCKKRNNDIETDHLPMEPDVSITIGESNLETTVCNVTEDDLNKCTKDSLNSNGGENLKKTFNKQKVGKKNHLKLPVNKNIKKKVSLFKLKNKHIKKTIESFQYQGIQSNIKFKCYKCLYSDFSTISELQVHQRKCIPGTSEFQSSNESVSFTNPTSNFRITRKVYLCSACGSYYENWNLFLHMKEIHKRHICLYCLGMFSQPDKLAQHLQAKHNVAELNLSSTEEFLKVYRGTCYLICVTCESMFSEQEDFYEHSCISKEDSICPLCGLRGAHFPTCRRGFSDHNSESDSQKLHPALGKKLTEKKKKIKSKKSKDTFKIINNEHNGEMSVIVRKQNIVDSQDPTSDSLAKETLLGQKDFLEKSVMSTLGISNEDITSSKQYNEKLLQLYRPNKTSEKVISSIQSIEDSINRVVESARMENRSANVFEEQENGELSFDESEKVTPDCKKDSAQHFLQADYHHDNESTLKIEERKLNNFEEGQNHVLQNGIKAVVNSTKSSSKENNYPILSDSESTDSEKLTIAFDQPSEQVTDKLEEIPESANSCVKPDDNIPTASKDSCYIYVSLKEEYNDVKALIKELVKVSCWNCVYCSHAKRIALNGKQLALHILAEHRFVTVSEGSSDEEKDKSASGIIDKLKNNMPALSNCFFNTDTFDSENKDFWKANDRIYECFHCLFATYVHKELCSHNRKMHQKAVFLCIMCKSNFYTYSELLCHLCPGIYVSGQVINPDITYRCFLCDVDPLPSSFRLMVHLRRKHNSCDICFDQSSNQFQLSTHVWKHKLSHMCYRCGIAYRNKPDITKHLFWKHGTESVLCKKCLQKKWPHVYHFCVPPNSFICDECSASLKSAIALKVHKRLHSGVYPYPCSKCEESFISRKLLDKHLTKHEEEESNIQAVPETTEIESDKSSKNVKIELKNNEADNNDSGELGKKPEKEKRPKRRKVLNDVFDLPPVNLSESDDSDQDELEVKADLKKSDLPAEELSVCNGPINGDILKEETTPTQIVDGVWNNFQNYLVAKDMPKTFKPASPFRKMSLNLIKEIMLSDHDYHITSTSSIQDWISSKLEPEKSSDKSKKVGLDHDYCNNVQKPKISCKSKQKTKHREDASRTSSSESSSDTDTSCSCGSNCSCSCGSSSSTSSNDSDSDTRDKRKQKKSARLHSKETNEVEPEPPTEVDISVHDANNKNVIRESDLETDETETDEDFYDFNPAREANRILAEKRTQLLANLNGSDAVTSSPSLGAEKLTSPKKKAKFKKKRSVSRVTTAPKAGRKKVGAASTPFNKNRLSHFGSRGNGDVMNSSISCDTPPGQSYGKIRIDESIQSSGEGDSKRPKRKRVPLKFYGFSSDDESEVTPASRKREKVEHNSIAPAPSPVTNSSLNTSADTGPVLWNLNTKNSLSWKVDKSDPDTPKVNPIKIRATQSMKQVPVLDSPSATDPLQIKRLERNFQLNGNPVAQKGEKLYCFCQCPYDEVSEMIACDAEDCVIEWFHFECVGIMVPPKGSWYCPDCRKKLAAENEFLLPQGNEQN